MIQGNELVAEFLVLDAMSLSLGYYKLALFGPDPLCIDIATAKSAIDSPINLPVHYSQVSVPLRLQCELSSHMSYIL
jgi:hypothetical protein